MMNNGSFADALNRTARHRAGARWPSPRQGRKHVSVYVDPPVARQLRVLTSAEDSSTQALIEEAIGMLFQDRGASAP